MDKLKIFIAGIVGVPSRYGGFETLAENLARYHSCAKHNSELTIWCSRKDSLERPKKFKTSLLRYTKFRANGVQSIFYDIACIFKSAYLGSDVILVLGVSGAICFPLIRVLFSKSRIITNIDGLEWKRSKWGPFASWFLRFSEGMAVRWSHVVIADNKIIADYVRSSYKVNCRTIPYGGDHVLQFKENPNCKEILPEKYFLSLCRIEPENNVEMILSAFAAMPGRNLVFIGNWSNSKYGQKIKVRYANYKNIYLIESIYDGGRLRWIRENSVAYVHGHSAGGTNPSLVEFMHFQRPVIAHGCSFNRETTENKARYFMSDAELVMEINTISNEQMHRVARDMKLIAQRRYIWQIIGAEYFDLFENKISPI